jgi:hypothetical protein
LIGIETEATETTNIQAHFNSQANIDMFLRCGVDHRRQITTILKSAIVKIHRRDLNFDKYEIGFRKKVT